MKSNLLALVRRPAGLALLAIAQFPIVSMTLLEVIDQARCALWHCEVDDASMRATALVGALLEAGYMLLSLLMVLPLMLLLRHWLGKLMSPLLAAALFGMLGAWAFHDPKVDSFAWIASLALWLAAPWFLAGAMACALWPAEVTMLPSTKVRTRCLRGASRHERALEHLPEDVPDNRTSAPSRSAPSSTPPSSRQEP